MILLGPAPCHSCGVPLRWDGRHWLEGDALHRCRRPACMTVVEYTAWTATNSALVRRAPSPCADCLPAFAFEMRRLGDCDGVPGSLRLPSSVGEDRRRQWRESARRSRAKRRAAAA